MNLFELDEYFNSILHRENFPSDPATNGIQIQNGNPYADIKKVAFAVDASAQTAELALKNGAQALFVHHGIFWGHCQPITGSFYKRTAEFIKNDLALIAYHIPLDANPEIGNNYGTAFRLNMQNLLPFGSWKGMTIGVKGELPKPMTIEELAKCAMRSNKKAPVILNFGKNDIKTVGIISGGASQDVEQAVQQGLDAYITGEFEHEQYHFIKESGINVIAGGHYETETVGVSLLNEKLQKETGIQTIFIDVPTGL